MANFEEQIDELEKVVEQLEKGDLPLEQSVDLYERGIKLSNACKTQLASAESRIQVLIEPNERGPARTADLEVDDEDAFEEGSDEESEDEA
jgi:exodeoxyribonuclease VII small subunit